ncbi:unnamed protein product [Paramecium pentaurelia]|uniref:cytochrome-b5 reductase n=1 Tax=Paramecium pentaurelia TaxID=43138 RepID=A0A8S1XJ74_9CILI|nr:unnamed protein product [Paramecium pentaurelia]
MDQKDFKIDTLSEFFTKKFQVTLTQREPINHDSYMFRFDFKNPKERLGMQAVQHIKIYGLNMKGEIVDRAYTHIFEDDGYFLIPIKIYRPNVHPQFPNGGELTPWLEKLDLHSELTIKRCVGKLFYHNNQFIVRPKLNKTWQQFETVLLICGGSGITPAYQLIKTICDNPNDNTKMVLLYANKTEQDIWLLKELNELQTKHKDQFTVHFTLDKSDENWKGLKGFVTLEMITSIFPKLTETTLGVLCGPKPMNKLVISLYEQIGLKKDNIVKF